MAIPCEIRRQAKEAGIPLSVLESTYREFRQLARLELEPIWRIRQRVWEYYAYTPASREFWRHGMHVRFRRAFEDGDSANIPRWDDVAKSLACEFPELGGEEDIGQRLFELIREPHKTMPSTDATWREALEYCLERYPAVAETAAEQEVPF